MISKETPSTRHFQIIYEYIYLFFILLWFNLHLRTDGPLIIILLFSHFSHITILNLVHVFHQTPLYVLCIGNFSLQHSATINQNCMMLLMLLCPPTYQVFQQQTDFYSISNLSLFHYPQFSSSPLDDISSKTQTCALFSLFGFFPSLFLNTFPFPST